MKMDWEREKEFSPLMCPRCGAPMEIVAGKEYASCAYCGMTCDLPKRSSTLEREGNLEIYNATIRIRDVDVKNLMENIEVSLEFGEFTKAQKYCDELYAADPENDSLYRYLLLLDEGCSKIDALSGLIVPFDQSFCYQNMQKYCNAQTLSETKQALQKIRKNGKNVLKNQLDHFLKIAGRLDVGDEFEYGFKGIFPIKWTVISTDFAELEAVVKDRIFSKSYYCREEDVPWEESDLRNWLNEDFPCLYFSLAQRTRLRRIPVETPEGIVNDRVSIRNIPDFRKYCKNEVWDVKPYIKLKINGWE